MDLNITKNDCVYYFNIEFDRLLIFLKDFIIINDFDIIKYNINHYINQFYIIKKSNIVKPIEEYALNVLKYKNHIYQKNIDYFFNDSFKNNYNENNNILDIIIKLKEVIIKMDKKNKQIIIDILILMTNYAENYTKKLYVEIIK